MRNARFILCAALFGAVLAIGATQTLTGTYSEAAGEKKAGPKDHWRYHDSHWNYWNDSDQRWYYTDGTNWFYNDNNNENPAWIVYGFDKQFGREGFERGEYKAPGDGTKIVSPRHGFYRVPNKK
jgi:hypothetical protein